MQFKQIAVLALLISGCSDAGPESDGATVETRGGSEDRALTAIVTGFGGPGSRRGYTNVYIRSGELTGVIPGVLPEELDCKVGDRIPAKKSGGAIVAFRNACRKTGVQGGLS